MPSPYVYAPSGGYSPYHPPSPFIPPAVPPSNGSPYASPYSSPYRATTALPEGSPHSPNAPLPGAPNTPLHGYEYPYNPWARQRRPSFHQTSTSPYDSTPPWLSAPPLSGHHRSRSFGEHTHPSPFPGYGYPPNPAGGYYSQGHYPQSPQHHHQHHGFHIHPLLDGENPRSDFAFDLSAPTFAPVKRAAYGHSALLSEEELHSPCTWPGLKRLRIICDLIPQWPLDITLDPSWQTTQSPLLGYTPEPRPISVEDILNQVYEHFMQRISQVDWADRKSVV